MFVSAIGSRVSSSCPECTSNSGCLLERRIQLGTIFRVSLGSVTAQSPERFRSGNLLPRQAQVTDTIPHMPLAGRNTCSAHANVLGNNDFKKVIPRVSLYLPRAFTDFHWLPQFSSVLTPT